jgi:hypothetical protein
MTTVLCAPAGWGKTLHADVLQSHFAACKTVDEWRANDPIQQGGLHLTNSISDALSALKIKGVTRVVIVPDATPVTDFLKA